MVPIPITLIERSFPLCVTDKPSVLNDVPRQSIHAGLHDSFISTNTLLSHSGDTTTELFLIILRP